MGMKFSFKVHLIGGEIIESDIEFDGDPTKIVDKSFKFFWEIIKNGWMVKDKKTCRFISSNQIKEVEVFAK